MTLNDAMAGVLRANRQNLGLTLERIAERIGRNVPLIHRLETGKVRITLDLLESIARAMQIPTLELMQRAEAYMHSGVLNDVS